MVRVDEPVAVSTNRTGEPIGFRWRNGSYLVLAKPVRWFARREWWIESARVQRGIGAGVLEVEMWRLRASCDATPPQSTGQPVDQPTQFELIHTVGEKDASKNIWKLVRIYN